MVGRGIARDGRSDWESSRARPQDCKRIIMHKRASSFTCRLRPQHGKQAYHEPLAHWKFNPCADVLHEAASCEAPTRQHVEIDLRRKLSQHHRPATHHQGWSSPRLVRGTRFVISARPPRAPVSVSHVSSAIAYSMACSSAMLCRAARALAATVSSSAAQTGPDQRSNCALSVGDCDAPNVSRRAAAAPLRVSARVPPLRCGEPSQILQHRRHGQAMPNVAPQDQALDVARARRRGVPLQQGNTAEGGEGIRSARSIIQDPQHGETLLEPRSRRSAAPLRQRDIDDDGRQADVPADLSVAPHLATLTLDPAPSNVISC